MFSYIQFEPLYFLYYPLVILIHELGHAFFVIIFRGRITEISIGFGKPLFQYRIFSIRSSLIGGFCNYSRGSSLTTYQSALFYLGGIIANTVTATAIWIFCDTTYADWYRPFIINSYVFAFFNLLPFKIPQVNLDSDGLQIINLIKSMRKA